MTTAIADLQDEITPETETATARPRRRWLKRSLIATGVLLVVLGGSAAAAVRYDNGRADRLLPGVVVAGRPVGGEVASAVVDRIDSRLPALGAKSIDVTAGPASAKATLASLGLRSDATQVLERVQRDARDLGLPSRLWHRLLNKPVKATYEVRYLLTESKAKAQVAALAKSVDREPVDARIDTSSGLVSIVPAVEGRSVNQVIGTRRLLIAGRQLANGGDEQPVTVPVATKEAAVKGYADVILVRVGENRLYHYENGNLAKTYTVATGQPKYPTPKGSFKIVLKRRLPTWINPDPKGWGKSMPASIPPGPKNPLGTRAMNLSAPGIRIHGTSNVRSLGTSASHGCIRMAMPEVEELFEKVDQGTPVIIIQGPAKAVAPPPAAATADTIGDPNAPIDLAGGG